MSDSVWITLEREHIEFADDLARRWLESATSKNRPPTNGAPTDRKKAHKLDIIGARCEAAAKLYLNPVKWNICENIGGKIPDFEDWIDVKGRSKCTYDLCVQIKGNPWWAYLLVYGDKHPLYEIVGWCWGFEAQWTRITDPAGGRPGHFVKRDAPVMKPPKTLFNELRDRQRLDALAHEWTDGR